MICFARSAYLDVHLKYLKLYYDLFFKCSGAACTIIRKIIFSSFFLVFIVYSTHTYQQSKSIRPGLVYFSYCNHPVSCTKQRSLYYRLWSDLFPRYSPRCARGLFHATHLNVLRVPRYSPQCARGLIHGTHLNVLGVSSTLLTSMC